MNELSLTLDLDTSEAVRKLEELKVMIAARMDELNHLNEFAKAMAALPLQK